MIKNIYDKSHYIFLILLFSWLSLFFFIGKFLSPIEIKNFYSLKYLNDVFGNLSILIFIINIILFFFLFKKNKSFFFIFFFFLIIAGQIVGSAYRVSIQVEVNYFFIISHLINIFNPFLICLNIFFLNRVKYFKILIITSFAIVLGTILFININYESRPSFDISIINTQRITSNGLGRLYLYIYLGLLIYLIKSMKTKIKEVFIFLVLFLLIYQFYILQSRFVFSAYIILTFYLYFLNYPNLKKKINIFIFLLILPLSIFISMGEKTTQNRIYLLQGEERANDYKIRNKNYDQENKKEKIKDFSIQRIDNLSTGRINKWIETFENIKKEKNFLGMGPQYDREINKKGQPWDKQGEDVANGLIYSILSGGIVSLLGYLLLSYFIFLENISFIKKRNIEKVNAIYSFCLLSSNMFILRSFVENSFTTWGVDNILFTASFFCLVFFRNKSQR